MTKKKLATILIAAVSAIALIAAAIMMIVGTVKPKLDITDQVMGYYIISVNPAIEIVVGANDNVLGVEAKNDDGEQIAQGYEFKNKTIKQVLAELIEIIADKGFIKEGEKTDIFIGYYSDYIVKSDDELIGLIPDEFNAMCEVQVRTGKASQRTTSAQTKLEGTPSITPTVSTTQAPVASITPSPSTESTPDKTEENKSSSGSNDGAAAGREHFTLKVKISGGNAIFSWNKYNYFGYKSSQIECTPKSTSTWKEDTPKVIKKITNESTTSCTISLSSLGFKGVGHELFFTLRAFEDSDGTPGTNYVSIKQVSSNSYEVYNNDPSPFGHGEVGVDYLPPSMTLNKESDCLVVRWTNQTNEDYTGTILYASQSSALPSHPGRNNAMYCYLPKNYTSYTINNKVNNLYALVPGKTYYFTLYSRFLNGTVVAGNTIKAVFPALSVETVTASIDIDAKILYVNWIKNLIHPDIDIHKLYITYTDEGSSTRVVYGEEYHAASPKMSGNSYYVETVPGRTYYIKIATLYDDGTEITGNEVSVHIPSATQTPTPEPTEEVTPTPSETPTETPAETPSESPSEEPTEEPTAEPTEEPTEEPSEEPSEEPAG